MAPSGCRHRCIARARIGVALLLLSALASAHPHHHPSGPPPPFRSISAAGVQVFGAPAASIAPPAAASNPDSQPVSDAVTDSAPALAPSAPVAQAHIASDGSIGAWPQRLSAPRLRPYGAAWIRPHLRGVSNPGGLPLHDLAATIARVSSQFGVDPALVGAVIQAESGYRPGAVSPKGAMGLMQLMPATAARFGVSNPIDPDQNIRGGTAYLAWLLRRYAGNTTLAVAGYNAGENAVERWRGIPPYLETQRYVRRVQSLYARGAWRPAALTQVLAPIAWRTIDASGEHALN